VMKQLLLAMLRIKVNSGPKTYYISRLFIKQIKEHTPNNFRVINSCVLKISVDPAYIEIKISLCGPKSFKSFIIGFVFSLVQLGFGLKPSLHSLEQTHDR
jgi:hypothetical protein